MAYTLERLAADCRSALERDPGPPGREEVRGFVSRACLDEEFVATHLGPENDSPRKVLHEDEGSVSASSPTSTTARTRAAPTTTGRAGRSTVRRRA